MRTEAAIGGILKGLQLAKDRIILKTISKLLIFISMVSVLKINLIGHGMLNILSFRSKSITAIPYAEKGRSSMKLSKKIPAYDHPQ